jgi:hypothetical protein
MEQTNPDFARVPVSPTLPSPSTEGQGVDCLEPASRPFIFYEDFLQWSLVIWDDRCAVESCMKELREQYNSFGEPRPLLLRPWSRKKGEWPYAIYWVHLLKRPKRFDPMTGRPITDTRPRWFKRLKIRQLRDLDLAIHRAGLDQDRPRIHRFHAEAQLLNETHRVLARTLDSARKTLGGRAAGAGLKAPPFPEDVGPRIPHDLRALATPAWRLECLLQRANSDLGLLAKTQARQRLWLGLRLEFRWSPEDPVGHIVWRDLETRTTYSRLNDRTKRKLGLSAEKRKAITPFEVERRRLVAGQKAGLSIARKLLTRAEAAMDTARVNFQGLKIAPPKFEI